jgi:hypothetical protein
MAIYTASGATYTPTSGSFLWTNTANGFDGNFSTFAHWTFSTTNDSNTIQAGATANWSSASDGQAIRIAKCKFTITASGLSATRRGRLMIYVSTDGGANFGPAGGIIAKDELGNDVTWFGTNANFTGGISYTIPAGVSGANFRLKVVGESPGDNRGFINNRSATLDIYELYIDSSSEGNARMIAMLIPSTI